MGLLFLFLNTLWFLYIGTTFDQLIPSFDALAYLLDTAMLKEVNFNFKEYLYRYEIMGGTQIYDIYGIPSFLRLYQLVPFLDLHPITMFNGYIIYYQMLLGYFGAKSVVLFREYFYGEVTEEKLPRILMGLAFSFMPMLGLRILHGHVNVELISIPLFFVVVLGLQLGRFSLLDLLLVNLSLFTLSPPNGQLAVYVAFFPLIVYAGLSCEIFRQGNRKQLMMGLFVLVTGAIGFFIIFFPELLDRMNYIKGPDALRSLDTKNMVYSYTTHTLRDFLSSFFFMLEPFSTRDNPFLFHETNYPTGPIVLLLCFLPWKKHKVFLGSFVLTVIFLFGLSMNIDPIQKIVLGINPLLNSFRVPARSLNIFIIISFILVFTYVLHKSNFQKVSEKFRELPLLIKFVSAVFLIALLYSPPVVREGLFFGFFLFLIYTYLKPAPRWSVVYLLALPILTCTFLSAFHERYTVSGITMKSFDEGRALGSEIKKLYPDLANPLTRVTTVGNLGRFELNLPLLLGLSSIDGYRLMHKKFIFTVNGIRGFSTGNDQLHNLFTPADPNYDLVSDMYNIKAILPVDIDKGKVGVKILERESRPAWFVKEIGPTLDYQMLSENKHLIYQKAFVFNGLESQFPGDFTGCESSRIQSYDSKFDSQLAKFEVNTALDCPMIVATNYTEKLDAFDGKSGSVLKKFPAWGSLMGFIVPAGTTEVVVRPVVSYPKWIDYLGHGGWILILLQVVYLLRGLLIPFLPGHRRNST